MGKVSKKILTEAEEKKKKTIQDAEKQAKEILEEAAKKAAGIKNIGKEKAEVVKKRELERNLSIFRMSLKIERLRVKNEIIDELKKFIEGKIKKLDWASEYKPFIEKLILEMSENKDEEIIVGQLHNENVKSLIKTLNKKEGNFKINNKKADFEAGIVLEKGNKRMNASLPVLLEESMDELKEDIVKLLF